VAVMCIMWLHSHRQVSRVSHFSSLHTLYIQSMYPKFTYTLVGVYLSSLVYVQFTGTPHKVYVHLGV